MPPTVLRKDAPYGPGSLQLFVASDYEQHYFTLLEEGGREDELRVFCAFDVVANNADRKSGHVLYATDGRLWGIDHGLCFHVQPKLRTVIWDFAEEEVPEDVVEDLGRLAGLGPPRRGGRAAVAGRGRRGAGAGRPADRRGRLSRAPGRPAAVPVAPGVTAASGHQPPRSG